MLSVEDLAAIEAIKQLKAQQCYFVDKPWPRWGSLFAPDALVDERDGIPDGMDAFVEWPLV